MSFREDLPLPEPSPEENPDNGGYPILEAYDELMLARDSEVYLDALERYIYQNVTSNWEVKDQILQFLKLYRAENAKGLDKVADILKQNLRCYCDCEGSNG
jgi:hypothetical protein